MRDTFYILVRLSWALSLLTGVRRSLLVLQPVLRNLAILCNVAPSTTSVVMAVREIPIRLSNLDLSLVLTGASKIVLIELGTDY